MKNDWGNINASTGHLLNRLKFSCFVCQIAVKWGKIKQYIMLGQQESIVNAR